MLKRTIRQYDFRSDDEADRLEILSALRSLAALVNGAHLAEVTVESISKTGLVVVTIEEVEMP